MILTLSQLEPITVCDFLADTMDPDRVYELVDGEWMLMPAESDRNQRIASFLFAIFLNFGIPFYRLRIGAELVVSGVRATVRLPDLMVLSEEGAIVLEGASRSTITLDMPPPRLVVEVVSPGQENADRDYRYKRSQYEARGIPEYWIVDPQQQCITVLSWVEGLYEMAVFNGEMNVKSSLLEELGQSLTAEAILHTDLSRSMGTKPCSD